LRQPEGGDLDHGVGLAVAVATTHVLPPAELLDDDLLGFELIDDLADAADALNYGRTNDCITVSARDQEKLEEDGPACDATIRTHTADMIMDKTLNER
jgi:hypothetical protein